MIGVRARSPAVSQRRRAVDRSGWPGSCTAHDIPADRRVPAPPRRTCACVELDEGPVLTNIVVRAREYADRAASDGGLGSRSPRCRRSCASARTRMTARRAPGRTWTSAPRRSCPVLRERAAQTEELRCCHRLSPSFRRAGFFRACRRAALGSRPRGSGVQRGHHRRSHLRYPASVLSVSSSTAGTSASTGGSGRRIGGGPARLHLLIVHHRGRGQRGDGGNVLTGPGHSPAVQTCHGASAASPRPGQAARAGRR